MGAHLNLNGAPSRNEGTTKRMGEGSTPRACPLSTYSSHSGGSNAASTGKRVGLGIARRPVDNLLSNTSNFSAVIDDIDTTDLPKPDRLVNNNKTERAISNDSIMTRNLEIFANGLNTTDGDNILDANSSDSNLNYNDMKTEEKLIKDLNHLAIGAILSDGQDISIVSSTNDSTLGGAYISNNILDDSVVKSDSVNTIRLNSVCIDDIEESYTAPRTKYFFQNAIKPKSQTVTTNNGTLSKNMNNNNSTGSFSQLKTNHGRILPGTSKLYGHSNSTSAILPNNGGFLTPSQRFRLRREKNDTLLRSSIRSKEKYYEEQESSGMELQEGDIDNSMIWSIPMASFSTSSFLRSSNDLNSNINHSSSKFEKGRYKTTGQIPKRNPLGPNVGFMNPPQLSTFDFYAMPTSPVPGINNTSDIQFFKDTTENLSSVYLHSSNRLSKSRLLERSDSAECLPIEFKDASNNGMEDLLLVSENKLDAVSHSRPSWLPPKDSSEKKLHENQISKTMSMASIEQLDRNKGDEERHLRNETNKQKYVIFLDSGITRKSSLQSMNKIIWETPLTPETRYKVYDEILQSDARIITTQYIESFEELMQLLNKMDFPRNKEAEIEKMIGNDIKNKIGGNYEISSDLLLMLQLKSISQQGLIPGDDLLFHHFLLDPSTDGTLKQIWELVNLIQMTCFNDTTREKYDAKILESRGVVSHYLSQDESFKNEFNASCLNSSTWWNILERVDHDLFMWIMDIIIVTNSQSFKKFPIKKEDFINKSWEHYRSKKVIVEYQILISFALNVLLNYHFGFNDLKSLPALDEQSFCIPMPLGHLVNQSFVNSIFIKKWLHYYRKF